MNEILSIDSGGKTLRLNRRDFLAGALTGSAALAWAPAMLAAAEQEAANPPALPAGKKIKVGLIGCGSVSGSYLPNLRETEFVEVVSVCDIVPERARRRANEFKVANWFPDVDRMLAGPHFDLLVNTTSMPSHFPVNKRALEAGRHVWSEKPMALEVAEARELLALAAKQKVRLWAAPTCVLSPQFRFMAGAIAAGKLGRVTAAHGTYGHNGPSWSAWFYEKGGGSLYDLGVYNVTTLTGLLGPVRAVVGMTAVLNKTRKVDDRGEVAVEADENTMLIMDHGNGVLSHVQTGFGYFDGETAPARERKLYTIDVVGTGGAMHLQGWDWGPVAVDVATPARTSLTPGARDPWPDGWAGGARYAARCLLTGDRGLITPEHGLHALEVMNACHESQHTGQRVAVGSTFDWPIVKG